ncbi:hypothetical protein J2T13_000745 [Paenibacillus sp. DS2015]|uniref:S-layer homology domain-containing protein n=1 Tax=Paenibacillus sp. DS2015 TaxID=3373917 RepID=UPI003D24EAC1
MKVFIKLLMVGSIAFSGMTGFITNVSVAASVSSFNDIKAGFWAESTIRAAVEKGYVDGYPGGLFKPNQEVTRAEFVKMSVTALGISVEKGTGKWYEDYVKVAQERKLYLASDFNNQESEWNKAMTRAEMAKVAVRATGKLETEEDKWMYLATKRGLITGLGAGQLGLNEKTTRAQSVTIIERILKVNKGETLAVDKYAVSSAELAWHGTNIFTVMPEFFVDSRKTENVEELWNEEKMTITSKDSLWKGQLIELIAIDLEDPKDPNLKQIPAISKLKWENEAQSMQKGIAVSKFMDSYILYFKTKVLYNKAPDKYFDKSYVPFDFTGLNSPNEDLFYAGKQLNMVARVFENKALDLSMFIVPKKGWKQGTDLRIELRVPSFSSHNFMHQDVLKVSGPQ